MILFGWAILGVALGAVGSEILRAKMPHLVGKVEDAAKRFVDSFSVKTGDAKVKKKPGDDDPFA